MDGRGGGLADATAPSILERLLGRVKQALSPTHSPAFLCPRDFSRSRLAATRRLGLLSSPFFLPLCDLEQIL